MLQRQRIQAVRHEARRRGELLSDSCNTSNRSTPRTPPLVPDTAPPYRPIGDAANVTKCDVDKRGDEDTALHMIDQNSKPDKSAATKALAGDTSANAQAEGTHNSNDGEVQKALAPHLSFALQPLAARTSAERSSEVTTAAVVATESNAVLHYDVVVDPVPHEVSEATGQILGSDIVLRTPLPQRSPDARQLFADEANNAAQETPRGGEAAANSPLPGREGSGGSASDTPNPRLHNAFLTMRQHQQAALHRPSQPEGVHGALARGLPTELSHGAYGNNSNNSAHALYSAAAAGQGDGLAQQSLTSTSSSSVRPAGNGPIPPTSLAATSTALSPTTATMQTGSPSSARRDSIARIENSLVQLQLELAKEKKHNLEAEQRIFALQREMEAVRNENASLTHSLERYRAAYPDFTANNNNNREGGSDEEEAGQKKAGNASANGTMQAMLSRVQTLEQHVGSLTELLQSKQAELDTKTERIRRLEHKLADTLLATESPTLSRPAALSEFAGSANRALASAAAPKYNKAEAADKPRDEEPNRLRLSNDSAGSTTTATTTTMRLMHPTFVDAAPLIASSGSGVLMTGSKSKRSKREDTAAAGGAPQAYMRGTGGMSKTMSSPRKAEAAQRTRNAHNARLEGESSSSSALFGSRTQAELPERVRPVASARRASNAGSTALHRVSVAHSAVLPSTSSAHARTASENNVVDARVSGDADAQSTRTSTAASSTTLVTSNANLTATHTAAAAKKKNNKTRPPTLNESALELQPTRIGGGGQPHRLQQPPASAMAFNARAVSARARRSSLAQTTAPSSVAHHTLAAASAVRRRPASPMKRSATNREYSLTSTLHASKEHGTAHDTHQPAGPGLREGNEPRGSTSTSNYTEVHGAALRPNEEPESLPSEVASASDLLQSYPNASTTTTTNTHAELFAPPTTTSNNNSRRRTTPQRTASATRRNDTSNLSGTHPHQHQRPLTPRGEALRHSNSVVVRSSSATHQRDDHVESLRRPSSARRLSSSNSARRASSPAILQNRKASIASATANGDHVVLESSNNNNNGNNNSTNNMEGRPLVHSSSVTLGMLEERPLLSANTYTPLASLAPPPPRSMLACRRPSPARSIGVTTSVRMNTAMRTRPQISYNAKDDATTIKGTTTTVVLRGATPSVGRSGSAALQRPPSRASPSRSTASNARTEAAANPLVAEAYDTTFVSHATRNEASSEEGGRQASYAAAGGVPGQSEARLPRMNSSQSPGEEAALAMTRAGSSVAE